jgi:hypothetical protein
MRIMSSGRWRGRAKHAGGSERGVVLILVMMSVTLLAVLSGALALVALTETAVAANYRDADEALYAADAAMEYVLQEIARVEDWTDLLATAGLSSFVDGEPSGLRDAGSEPIDLDQATVDVTAAATPPAGAVDEPSVLYAFGRFADLVPGTATGSMTYVAVWLADRSPAPKEDATEPVTLSVAGVAFGGRGSRRAVEALVQKTDSAAVRLLAWRELP